MAVLTIRFADDELGGVNVTLDCDTEVNEGDPYTPAMEVATTVFSAVGAIKDAALEYLKLEEESA